MNLPLVAVAAIEKPVATSKIPVLNIVACVDMDKPPAVNCNSSFDLLELCVAVVHDHLRSPMLVSAVVES